MLNTQVFSSRRGAFQAFLVRRLPLSRSGVIRKYMAISPDR